MSYLGRSAKLSLKAQEKVSFLATAGQTVKTGLSYVPSFVEVYVNGVLLTDTTDFTATNGNSVTFTVALLLNDEVTVISLKTFTVADHYSKTEADTLLAAKSPLASPVFTGNVLVGKSSQDSSLSGCELLNNGTAQFTRDGNSGLRINRLTSDGELLRLSKAGTTVGSIRSDSGSIMLGSGDVGVYFDAPSDRILPTNITAGSVRNDAIDIGGNPHRFKDLYLSGGVYLGGTGAANKLDDYEEGTWTPTFTNASIQSGSYIKIGDMVYCTAQIQTSSAGVSGAVISGLPFTTFNTGGGRGGGAVTYQTENSTEMWQILVELSNTNFTIRLGNADRQLSASKGAFLSFSYRAV